MPVADLLRTPKGEIQTRDWLFQNAQDHLLIIATIQRVYGTQLPSYVLDPVDLENPMRFLDDHQSAHSDMDNFLGIRSSDMSTLDFNDPRQVDAWIWENWIEHQQAHAILGI